MDLSISATSHEVITPETARAWLKKARILRSWLELVEQRIRDLVREHEIPGLELQKRNRTSLRAEHKGRKIFEAVRESGLPSDDAWARIGSLDVTVDVVKVLCLDSWLEKVQYESLREVEIT